MAARDHRRAPDDGRLRPPARSVRAVRDQRDAALLGELGLPETAAHTLLGQAVEYDLGNIYDPAYVMVCKIRKDTLRSIGLSADEP